MTDDGSVGAGRGSDTGGQGLRASAAVRVVFRLFLYLGLMIPAFIALISLPELNEDANIASLALYPFLGIVILMLICVGGWVLFHASDTKTVFAVVVVAYAGIIAFGFVLSALTERLLLERNLSSALVLIGYAFPLLIMLLVGIDLATKNAKRVTAGRPGPHATTGRLGLMVYLASALPIVALLGMAYFLIFTSSIDEATGDCQLTVVNITIERAPLIVVTVILLLLVTTTWAKLESSLFHPRVTIWLLVGVVSIVCLFGAALGIAFAPETVTWMEHYDFQQGCEIFRG